jgi:hypothetical protein
MTASSGSVLPSTLVRRPRTGRSRRRSVEGKYVLTEESFCGEEQRAAPLRVLRGDPCMGNRGGFQAAYACLAAQCPLTSHDGVVIKGSEREPLRASPAGARGLDGLQRLACAERIEAEVPRPKSHPARMPAGRTKADPLGVHSDPVRPQGEGCPKSRIVRVRGRGKRQRDRSQRAECKCTDPTPGDALAFFVSERPQSTRRVELKANVSATSRRSSGRRPGCSRPGHRRLGRRPAHDLLPY